MISFSLIVLSIGVNIPAEMQHAEHVASNSDFSSSVASQRLLVYSEAPASVEYVEIALARFAKASLIPPVIEFHFYSDLSGCDGYRGLHAIEDGHHRVDVCARGRSDNLILHEIAHAWVGENVSNEQRAEFLGLRGLDVWNDAHTPWRGRGTEHAASVLAWGLSERCSAAPGIPAYNPVRMLESFVFLSGRQPICESAINDHGRPKKTASDRRGGVQM